MLLGYLGIAMSIALSLAAFYFSDSSLVSVSGYAVHVPPEYQPDQGVLSGLSFDAAVDGKEYYYIFSDGEWYESKDLLRWEYRVDMKDTLYEGLVYLKTYDADIYFKQEKIEDLDLFMRSLQ